MNPKHMTRCELFSAMINRSHVRHLGEAWLVNGMDIEDGGGFRFILNLCCVGSHQYIKLYVDTKDMQGLANPLAMPTDAQLAS